MRYTYKKIDVYMIIFFIYFFCLINFLYFNINKIKILDFIMFGILFFLCIITYFKGLIVGLIASTFVIFIYASYILYGNMILIKKIEITNYIWMISIPLNTFIIGNLSKNIALLQKINKDFQNKYKEYVTIDDNTGFDNLKSFYINLNKEMSMSTRHKFPLTLMLLKISHYEDLYGVFGEKNMLDILKEMSKSIHGITRDEDKRFKIDKDTFAIIMANTDLNRAKVAKDRIKEGIKDINLNLKNKMRNINIDVRTGIYEYNKYINDSFEFKQLAEQELEYDV